jgi:hypothetical protein
MSNIYMTAGQVPETIMSGNIADISHMAEFGWYEWVMICNNQPSNPDNNLVLSCYLGSAIDTGLALTAKILKMRADQPCNTSSIALSIKGCNASLMGPQNNILGQWQCHRTSLLKT